MSAPTPVGAGRRSSVLCLVSERIRTAEHCGCMRWWDPVGACRVVRLLYGTAFERVCVGECESCWHAADNGSSGVVATRWIGAQGKLTVGRGAGDALGDSVAFSVRLRSIDRRSGRLCPSRVSGRWPARGRASSSASQARRLQWGLDARDRHRVPRDRSSSTSGMCVRRSYGVLVSVGRGCRVR